MVTQLLFDKLAYVDRLKASGIGEQQARAHAEGLEQAFREEVATKTDLAKLETKIGTDLAKLETKIELAKNSILVTIIGASFGIIGGVFTLIKLVR